MTMLNMRQRIGMAMVGFAMIGAGCAIDAPDPDENAFDQSMLRPQTGGGTGGDPGIPNHLRPTRFWDHAFQQTARDLGNAAIADGNHVMPEMPHMRPNDADGYVGWRQDVLGVLVECALSEKDTVIDPEDPTLATKYFGRVGLAPDWMTRALTKEEKYLVTGCMLDRLNKYGVVVQILLEGNADAIQPNAANEALYPVAEASMWGNMFDSTVPLSPKMAPDLQPDVAFAAYSCDEHGVFSCGALAVNYALTRVCDSGYANCGVNLIGQCGFVCQGTPVVEACDGFDYRVQDRLPDILEMCGIGF